MIIPPRLHHRWLGLLAAGAILSGGSLPAADSLTWRKDQNRVDADVNSWNALQVLERVAKATGWKVYIDPGAASRKVSIRFKDRPADKALDLLLGNLNRVLLPPTNGSNPRLLVFRNSEKEATQLVRARDADKDPKHIANELIVQLKPGGDIDALAKKLGAKIVGRDDKLNAYRLRFDSEEAANAARETLKNHEDVASVDYNYPVFRDPDAGSLGTGSLPADMTPKANPNCDGVVIGMIDTALHPQGNGIDEFLLPSISVVDEAKLAPGTPSHGDAMSQTALRGSTFVNNKNKDNEGSRVRILPVDVYGSQPTTSTYEVAVGVKKAIDAGAMIINMSLGSEGGTKILQDVIKSGHDQGVIFFGAAGNEPTTAPTYPAAYSEVIAVTAADNQGKIASYANHGEFVDVIAPGVAPVNFNNQVWRVAGTSAASAAAAGMAAGLAQQNIPCSGGVPPASYWSGIEKAIRQNLAVKPEAAK